MERTRSIVQQSSGSASVKIGGLWKRSQGLSRLTKPNYKHRVFILTDTALSYYSGTVDRVGQQKRRVLLDSVRAVEFVDQTAFKLAHTFQIIYVSKKHGFVSLYVTATDNAECSDWVATLRQACYFNRDMLMHYHPGAMLKGRWSCCKHREKNTLGCQPTYHLLTRSSSRYAQIRRRDTLTSSSSTNRRSLGNSSNCHYGTMDRRATTGAVPINPQQQQGDSKPGQGLSNSCMDLSLHRTAAHQADSFLAQHDVAMSQCSSQLSSGPSVSLASITLNRISIADTSGSEFDCEEARVEPPKGSPKMAERRRIRCRQVAPESSASSVSQFPLEVEEKSVITRRSTPGSTDRPRGRSLDTQMMSSIQKSASLRESTQTYTLPRQKRLNTTSPLTGSVQYIPLARTAAAAAAATATKAAPPPNATSSSNSHRMKHSNTFVVSTFTHQSADSPSVLKSCSTSALSKPVIEPRVSSDDPSVVHV